MWLPCIVSLYLLNQSTGMFFNIEKQTRFNRPRKYLLVYKLKIINYENDKNQK